MIAEIISTGDEVLLGDIVDTNAAFLCTCLTQENIRVAGIRAVGDDIQQIADALTRAAKNADICIITGGLGPTRDDVTAPACARVCGQPLSLHSKALETITSYLTAKGYELTAGEEKQAMLPANAKILSNQWGSAPGFYLPIRKCLCFFLPGVPGEMKPMFETKALPVIRTLPALKNSRISIQRFTVFGMGESRSGELLKDFSDTFPDIRLGFRASFPYLEIKLVKSGDGSIPAGAQDFVLERLSDKIVSLTGQSLEEEVGKLLKQKEQTLAVAESCTGGLISSCLTDVPGASAYFLFGGITYANQAKESILQVSHDTLTTAGAVHEKTALEMAIGTKRRVNADWGLSTTGIAGPGGATEGKPVGTVCVGIAGPNDFTLARRYEFRFTDRAKNKRMFAAAALDLLRRSLKRENT